MFKQRVIRLPHKSLRERRSHAHALFRTLNPHGGSRPVSQGRSDTDVSGHGSPEHKHYEPSDIQQRHRNQRLFGKNVTNREVDMTPEEWKRFTEGMK